MLFSGFLALKNIATSRGALVTLCQSLMVKDFIYIEFNMSIIMQSEWRTAVVPYLRPRWKGPSSERPGGVGGCCGWGIGALSQRPDCQALC